MPSSYEKLITAAALAVSAGVVGIMLSVGGCASSNIDTTSPDSYLVITNLIGEPGDDGESSQGVLYSDCWEDKTKKEADPLNPGEEIECCIVGSGIFHDDYLSVTVTNNGKTGMEGQFQEVRFEGYRIVYYPAEGEVEVEGPFPVSLKVNSSTTISILAVPLELKPLGDCANVSLFPATITLLGTDISGDNHMVSSSFQVHFADWMGSACDDKPDCVTP
jgi:hypothetical protein